MDSLSKGRKRIKPEPSSDDDRPDVHPSHSNPDTTPKKRTKTSSTPHSPTKPPGTPSKLAAAIPEPYKPDPSITKARDGKVICTVLERCIMACGPEVRNEVAAYFGVEARLLPMAWADMVRKKAIIALRKEFVRGPSG